MILSIIRLAASSCGIKKLHYNKRKEEINLHDSGSDRSP